MGSIAEEEPMHPLPPYPYDTNRPNQTNPGTMFINSNPGSGTMFINSNPGTMFINSNPGTMFINSNPGTMFVNSEKWINQFFLA